MIPAKLHRGLTELQSINLLIGPDPSPEGEGFTDPPSGTLNRRSLLREVNVRYQSMVRIAGMPQFAQLQLRRAPFPSTARTYQPRRGFSPLVRVDAQAILAVLQDQQCSRRRNLHSSYHAFSLFTIEDAKIIRRFSNPLLLQKPYRFLAHSLQTAETPIGSDRENGDATWPNR